MTENQRDGAHERRHVWTLSLIITLVLLDGTQTLQIFG